MSSAHPFSDFPKKRVPLPPEYESIYLQHYRNSREGSSKILGLAKRAEAWMHRKVAEDVRQGAPKATLEIGAGTLNQLPYEPNSNPYDIVEPFHELFQSSPHRHRIRSFFDDISEVPPETKYERVTSIAALEHVCDLPELVARSALLLSEGGQFRAGIPSEGTILWRLGWATTTALDFRARYNLDYEVLMKYRARQHGPRDRDRPALLFCCRQLQRFRIGQVSFLLSVLRLLGAAPRPLPGLPGPPFLRASALRTAARIN